jgi:hypothetical protein
MLSFAELRDLRINRLQDAATAWDELAVKCRGLEQRVVEDLAGPLRRSGWAGTAASVAFKELSMIHDGFELTATQVNNISAVVGAAVEEFGRYQKQLYAAIDDARQLGLTVGEDGTVSAVEVMGEHVGPTAEHDWQQAAHTAASYTDAIHDILAKASDADGRFSDALRGFAPDDLTSPYGWNHATAAAQNATRLLGLTPDTIPGPGTDPTTVADWWAGLTPGQRDLLLTGYPDRIGALNGLPAVARDQANRLYLHDLIGNDSNNQVNPTDPHHQRLVNLLTRLDNSDYDPPARHLYLLGLNNDGDGQAIVAVGDPDTARHTAVLVPGVSTNLDGMNGQIARASQIQDAAARYNNGSVAVIAWLGYDPPQMNETVVAAAASHRAEVGAVSLDQFVDGLRASHTVGPDHITALGHSYGSVVVGDAASHGHHLAVDDIITAGSPGMDVDHATDLNVDPRHMWAGAAADDPIASPATAIPVAGPDVQADMWVGHGTEPQQPIFGGNAYHVDTHGHSGYWDNNSDSLRNQARIVVGLYQQVQLDSGQVPNEQLTSY